ncbi:MAG: hypothetical protein A3E84_03785 [Gammaproteobacteria bacterium RIFCSPHIGHO2_12_FULL_42_13]|nr:MAG: hypothetical protein A3E84_03785 [Gammaproteobacteria bacterium RIFCSPHIGHO2_12_FULL_42_13]
MFQRLLVLTCLLMVSSASFATEKLLFAVDIIRHGDRTPIYEIPKAPYQWKEGLGQLTTTGMKQEIKLGEALRKKYVNQYRLLPAKYQPETVYVRSTSWDRTIMSAEFLLRGLYPDNTRSLDYYAAIPIDTVPNEDDNLLLAKPNKNVFAIAKNYLINKKSWHDQASTMQAKLNAWQAETGIPLTNFSNLNQLADNLRIRKLKNVPLPAGMSNQDAEQIMAMSEAADVNAFKNKYNFPMGKECLKKINAYVNAAKSGKTPLKYVLFSGHDTTILSVMSALDTPLDTNPPYASHLNFSLYSNNDRYYVKVSYNDKPVNVPACGGDTCSLAQFASFIRT